MASLSNINGIFDVHSTGAILFSTSHGTSGQILRSNGNAAPTWVAASTVIGGPYLPLTGGTLSGPLSGTSATFSGILTAQSSSSGDYVRLYGASGTGKWDIYGNGANLRISDNESAGILVVDTGATFGGSVTAASASIPTMSVNTNFVGDIYQYGSLLKNDSYTNLANSKYTKKYRNTAYFINGNSNQAVNIYFPNVAMQGYLRITLSGSYSHQNITGKLTKVMPFGWNPNNSIWGSGDNYTIETAVGGVADTFTIGNVAWRSASSQYYIPIYKLTSAGNSVRILIEYFGGSGEQLNNVGLGGIYSISAPAPFNNRHYPSAERLQIGAGGFTGGVQYGIRLKQGTGDDSKIGWADNSGSERAAIICDSSTDSLHFYTGNSGTLSDRVRITAGGNVGIGTTGPVTKLHVSNTALINDAYGLALVENTSTGTGSAANSALNIKSKYGTSQFMQWENQGLRIGSRILNNGGVGNVYFTAGADSVKMVIQAGGQVRIGTTNTAALLNVGGPILASDNNQSAGMYVRRALTIGHPGNTGTFTRTFNPVTQFGISRLGGNVLLEVSGWSQKVNCGYIQFQNAGGGGNLTTVSYTQTAVSGTGSISVSINSANDNSIDINFSGWHTNGHAWQAKIITQ